MMFSRNFYLSMAVALTVGAAMTACSSDDSDEGEGKQKGMEAVKTYVMSVEATKRVSEAESRRTTRALTLTGRTLNASWATSEKVYVSYGNEWFNGSLSPNVAGSTARLNGTISDLSIPNPATLNLQFPRKEWNYTGQVGTLADIAEKYDYATASADVTVEATYVEAASSVTFENQQAIVRFTLMDGTNAVNPTSLRISASGLKTKKDIDGDETCGDLTITQSGSTNEIYAALRGVTGNLILTATTATKTYSYRKSSVSFTNGQYYQITVPMKEKTYPIALSAVTHHYVGSVVCTDGTVYATRSAAESAGKTPAAMIAYVSETGHGLALAANDESAQTFSEAQSITEETAVTGATWRLPTVADWRHIFIASGNGLAESDDSNPVSFAALQTRLEAAGISQLQQSEYWTKEDTYGYSVSFGEENATFTISSDDSSEYLIRACLEF